MNSRLLLLLPGRPGGRVLLLLLRKLLSILRVVVLIGREIRMGGSGSDVGGRGGRRGLRLIPGSRRLGLNAGPTGFACAAPIAARGITSQLAVQGTAPGAGGAVLVASHAHLEATDLCWACSGGSGGGSRSAFLVCHAHFDGLGAHARLPGHVGKCVVLFRFHAESDKTVSLGEARFVKDDLKGTSG
jgi:hypothetical protein